MVKVTQKERVICLQMQMVTGMRWLMQKATTRHLDFEMPIEMQKERVIYLRMQMVTKKHLVRVMHSDFEKQM
jgi:hypothetical protein